MSCGFRSSEVGTFYDAEGRVSHCRVFCARHHGWMDGCLLRLGPKLEAVMRVLPGWLGCVGEEPILAALDGMVELCYKFLALLVLPFHQQHGGV